MSYAVRPLNPLVLVGVTGDSTEWKGSARYSVMHWWKAPRFCSLFQLCCVGLQKSTYRQWGKLLQPIMNSQSCRWFEAFATPCCLKELAS